MHQKCRVSREGSIWSISHGYLLMFSLQTCFRASFVGLMYVSATTITSTIVVPVLSHSLNNLVGGMIWQYSKPGSNPRQFLCVLQVNCANIYRRWPEDASRISHSHVDSTYNFWTLPIHH
ncbi:uncharacterized protein J3R85_011346 [Psidium guajava]|nr:uncharacterized protein J3R85_011346 [Psidium guajava]